MHLCWCLSLRAGVAPWSRWRPWGCSGSSAAGGGHDWAFQVGFVGSVFFGLLAIELLDGYRRARPGPGPRLVYAGMDIVAALMCSTIGDAMLVASGGRAGGGPALPQTGPVGDRPAIGPVHRLVRHGRPHLGVSDHSTGSRWPGSATYPITSGRGCRRPWGRLQPAERRRRPSRRDAARGPSTSRAGCGPSSRPWSRAGRRCGLFTPSPPSDGTFRWSAPASRATSTSPWRCWCPDRASPQPGPRLPGGHARRRRPAGPDGAWQ